MTKKNQIIIFDDCINRNPKYGPHHKSVATLLIFGDMNHLLIPKCVDANVYDNMCIWHEISHRIARGCCSISIDPQLVSSFDRGPHISKTCLLYGLDSLFKKCPKNKCGWDHLIKETFFAVYLVGVFVERHLHWDMTQSAHLSTSPSHLGVQILGQC